MASQVHELEHAINKKLDELLTHAHDGTVPADKVKATVDHIKAAFKNLASDTGGGTHSSTHR